MAIAVLTETPHGTPQPECGTTAGAVIRSRAYAEHRREFQTGLFSEGEFPVG